MRWTLWIVLAAACGRVHFDPIGDDGDDAGTGDGLFLGDFAVSTPVRLNATPGWFPALVWADGVYGVAYAEFPDGDARAQLLRVDADGQVLSTTTASAVTGNVHESAIMWTGSEYVVAWSANGGIEAARLSAAGTKLSPDTRVSANGGFGCENPHGIFDGSGIAFVYTATSPYGVRFAIADPLLSVSADVQVRSNGSLTEGGVAPRATEYGVATSELAGPAEFSRHTASGAPIGTPIMLAPSVDGSVAIAATSTGYAVAWSTNDSMHVTTIDLSGAVEDRMIGTGHTPTLAWQGQRLGVAWTDSSAEQIVFAELEPSGAPASAVVTVSAAGNNAQQPRVVSDGTGYAIAWATGLGGNGIHFARVTRM
ncbi:MAG TPA: hypothetical protein VIV11_13985 [Kofleriaceae bacterium]